MGETQTIDHRSEGRAFRAVLQARLLDALGDAVIATDLDGTIVFWNHAAEGLFGWPAEEALGRTITEVTPAEQSREQAREIMECLTRGEQWQGDILLGRRDGTTFLAQVRDTPVYDGDGRLVGVVGVTRDRSAARLQEDRLRDEARLVDMLQRIGAALTRELDVRRIVQTVTDEATALTGARFGAFFYNVLNERGESYTLYTISGAPREAFSRFPMPRNTPVFEPTFRGTSVVRSDDITKDPRYGTMAPHFGMPAGHLSVVSYLAVPVLSSKGEALGGLFFGHEAPGVFGDREERVAVGIAGWAAVAMDNARLYAEAQAARRRAEASAARTELLQDVTVALAGAETVEEVGALVMARAVLSAGAYAGALALITDRGDEIELHASTGYPEAACMSRGRRWPLAASIPMAQAARGGQPAFIGSRDAWVARFGAYGPTGKLASMGQAWAALPLAVEGVTRGSLLWTFDHPHDFDEDEVRYFLSVAQQCAQALGRARLRGAERRARAEAEEANRAKMQFLTVMSHELRTPLNAIAGYADLLALGVRGPVTAAQKEDLDRIRRSQRHLLSLINDVLNFAKLEAGHVSLQVTTVRLAAVAAEVEALVAPQLRARGHQLDSPECDPAIAARADEEKLRQILLNLLSNAVKFTAPGGRIALTCERRGDRAVVQVRDTGAGIPADKLETIFEPFVQLDRNYTTASEGTGLGLAISRDLARVMGGDLTAESEPGVGSTFTLSLPAA
ncbi:MAG: ATP-binding protein [Gemmatimonadaceae bacterium]